MDAMAKAIEDAIAGLEKKATSSAGDEEAGGGANAKTGDEDNIAIWIALLLAACAGLMGTAAYRRKQG